MIDMGLVPPEGSAETNQNSPSLDGDGVEEDSGSDDAAAEEEPAEAIGLIGHFEAAVLVAQKGREGSFVGSLDMSMTERDLVSTEDGVGECASGSWPRNCCRSCPVTAQDNQVCCMLYVDHHTAFGPAENRVRLRKKRAAANRKRHVVLSPCSQQRRTFPSGLCFIRFIPCCLMFRSRVMVGREDRVRGLAALHSMRLLA